MKNRRTGIKLDYKPVDIACPSYRPNPHWRLRWTAFALGCVVLGVVMAKSQAPANDGSPARVRDAAATIVRQDLPLPEQTEPAPRTRATTHAVGIDHWREATVDAGDTFYRLLRDTGIDGATVRAIASAGEAGAAMARIYPGDSVRLGFDDGGRLMRLEYRKSPSRRIEFRRGADGFQGRIVKEPLQRRLHYARGTIETSLFEAGADAGLEDRLIMNLVSIFRWDIDFIYSVRPGDRFTVVYEAFYRNGEQVRTGDIVAAEFINRGTVHRAVRYQRANGDVGYFAPDGTSTRKAFLRTPVEFTRISSRYGRRKHPLLHRKRMHYGVDFAAPRGTPIHATGDGRIVFRGRKGGFGNMVAVDHPGKYRTRYGHMVRFASGKHVGSWVEQGDVIGYVGSTGLSTGPHVHYDFQINGHHANPLKVELPSVAPIADKRMDRFRQQIAPLVAQLDTFQRAYAEFDR